MKLMRKLSGLIAGFSFAVCLQVSAGNTIKLLHEFDGLDGGVPWADLTRGEDNFLYGMTYTGGDEDNRLGVIFKIGSGGSGFTILHKFTSNNGAKPTGSLIVDGSTLYGMTPHGGGNALGLIFKINTDGSDFTILHDFAGGADDGQFPYGSLTLDGPILYGMTLQGGDNNGGVIFSINTDASDYTILHEFAGGNEDGSMPTDSLTLHNSTLYGMTLQGGDNNGGVIFSINTDASDYKILHEFAGGANDGKEPWGALTLDNSSLYGMTYYGGDSDCGVVFKIGCNGEGFNLIHEFAGGANDGSSPDGSLIVDGSSLYGMTISGGDSNRGVIFKLGIEGADFTILHDFAGGADDGGTPLGSLILNGSGLSGMTMGGGDWDMGVVFSLSIPEIPVDFNGDRKSDVLVENSSGFHNGNVYFMDGPTPFANGEVYKKSDNDWQIIAFEDFNGDGKSDMLWLNSRTKQVLIYIMNGNMVIQTASVLQAGSSWELDKVADFNGDGNADILWKQPNTGDAYMFLMNGVSISFGSRIQKGFDWIAKSAGDYNGDGKADILWEIKGTIGYLCLMDGATVLKEDQIYSKSLWSIDKFGDFNGDGKWDILWRYSSGGKMSGYVQLMDGVTTLASSGYTYYSSNTNWNVIQVGDLNGDGRDDLLFQNSANGLGVGYLMNGSIPYSTGVIYTVTGAWSVLGLFDYNGDGKRDILWKNTVSNKTIDYIMNGLAVKNFGTIVGAGTNVPIVPSVLF